MTSPGLLDSREAATGAQPERRVKLAVFYMIGGYAACPTRQPRDAPMKSTRICLLLSSALLASAALADGSGTAAAALTRHKAPDGAKISLTGVKDGDTVTSPVKLGFSATGVKVAPAGTMDAGTGHFHLLTDADTLPSQDAPLPANEHVKHYGKAQTEDSVTLTPGKHTLQLELTDGLHLPFDPPLLSDKVTVTVK